MSQHHQDPYDHDAFLSHSSLDKDVVRDVAAFLTNRGIKVWFDEQSIDIGDLIPSKIDQGLARSRHIVLCMSPSFFQKSYWGELEVAAAKMSDPANHKARILPLFIEECEVPPTLTPLLFADYRQRDKNALARLCDRIHSTRPLLHSDSSQLPLTPPGLVRGLLDRCCPSFHHWLTRLGAFRLTFPPEHAALEAYNEEVYKTTSALLCEQTIVKLQAKSLEGRETQSLARGKEFHSSIQQVVREIEGREENQDAASATISALSRKSRPVRNLVARLLGDLEPLVLLGEPGAGKSLSIHQARLLIAERNSKRVFPDISIYIPLGEFHVPAAEVTDASLAEFVQSRVPAGIRPYLSALRRHHRLVVFLDGMDEMSRLRYNDHVEAISHYARAGEGKAKTIVACRTADFSPKFQHRRFVLLPFGRQQILSYLRLQFHPQKTVLIEGRHWTLRELGRQLSRSDLSINATSPYVLWMFCRFIHDEKKWPESRVHLLQHYYQARLRDRLTEAGKPCDARTISTAFAIWGRIAFELASVHRGISISIRDLRTAIGTQEVDEGIRLGRTAGALEMSFSPEEDADMALIKFEHHRAAEFFTAWHIHTTGKPVLWEELLDYPRWRETLLNILLLGGSGDARDAVEHALDEAAQLTSSTTDWKQERLLTERIEFAAKAHTDARQSPAFAQRLAAAVYNLAEMGNPITRIKMLEIARRTPDVDVYRVAEPSVNSPVQFLRTQALIVASASGNESSKDFLPDQFLFAFAKGEFLSRLPALLSVSISLRQLRPLLMLLCGLILFLLSPAAQLAAAWYAASWAERGAAAMPEVLENVKNDRSKVPGAFFTNWQHALVKRITGKEAFFQRQEKAVKQRADEAEKRLTPAEREAAAAKDRALKQAWVAVSQAFGHAHVKAAVLSLALLCWIVSAFRAAGYLHISAFFASLIGLLLVAVGILIGWGREGPAALCLMLSWVGILLSFLLYLPAHALFLGLLFLYSHAISRIGKRSVSSRRYLEACWDPASDTQLDVSLSLWGHWWHFALMMLGTSAYIFVINMAGALLPDSIMEWFLSSDMKSALFIGFPMAVVPFLISFDTKSLGKRLLQVVLGLVLIAALLLGFEAVIAFFKNHSTLIDILLTLGTWLFRLLILAAIFMLVRYIGQLLWPLVQRLQREFEARVQPARDTRTWEQKFATADASHQAVLLRQVSADQLGLKPEEFLEFLADTCEPLLRVGDPPDSDYWSKRQEASELARLEREGT